MKARAVAGLGAVVVAGGVFAAIGAQPTRAKESVTFSEDVAPIVFNKCASCHRAGEAAPFTLQTYDDVRRRGRIIASAVEKRVMPPWKAAPGDYSFKADRRLSDPEIQTIQQWVAAGMPEGDPKQLPRMPSFTPGWQLGQPDLVVAMPEGFEVPASGPDVYRNFVLPLNLSEDRWVRAVDFRPSARSVVHHSLFSLDTTGSARQQDEGDPRPGFAGTMGGGFRRGNLVALLGGRGAGAGAGRQGRQGDSSNVEAVNRAAAGLGGYALGAPPKMLPDGLAYLVPKGSDLILSTHFHPSGKPEKEASTVGLYFASAPPKQAFSGVQLPPVFGVFEGIEIPPGEKAYTITDSFTLPVDVKAFNAGAHAHYLAKQMKLTATFPDGATKTLLAIDDWDFAWQEQYQFTDYVLLPRGTRLDTTITYDNSAANPRNPSSPPKRVTWGEQSTDEMGSMGLQVVAVHPGDLVRLQAEYAQHVREKAMTGSSALMQILQRRGRGR